MWVMPWIRRLEFCHLEVFSTFQVWFKLRDGSLRDYGSSEGGVEQGPWALEPGEHIVAVEQAPERV